MNKIAILALVVFLPAAAASAEGTGSMNGAGYVGGNVPGEMKQATAGSTGAYVTDVDGDGCLEKNEVPPDSQLAKRFDARDTNHDGKLCKDEYFVK